MMSIFLTEQLKGHTACIYNAHLVFFFCSAEDKGRNTAIAVLCGLVHQIIVKRPQLVKHALPYFETPERTQQTLSSLEALWLIFSNLIADAELGTIFCVIDGLDECDESTLGVLVPRVVSLLTGDALSSAKGTFKLAIVSRDLPGLRGCTTRVRLDPDNDEKVDSDIKLFMSARVAELLRIEGFSEDFQASVETALLKRAEGTFLWVGYAMHELSQKQTCSEIWEALEDLPSSLPAIYSRMLLRIPARQKDVSRAILRWVTLAVRPLQLQELAAAVGIQATPQMTVEQAARDAVTLCGPLLKVQEREVSLVHQSARDYLLRKERDSDAVLEAFRLNLESAHLELAQKCLNCIAQSDLQHRVIDLDAELDPQESPLLRYATLHWPEHAKSCSALAAKLFDPYGFFLQKVSSLRINWWETYNKRVNRYKCEPPPLLHMACRLEIISWAEAVLAKKRWRTRHHKRVNEKNKDGKTVLHWAAWRGNEAMVRLLVDLGADINAKDNDRKTVLHSAVRGGNKVVVRLLVDRGADVKAKDNYRKTVLHWAAEGGYETVVRLLVERGADVKAKDNNGTTALYLAASGGDEAMVRLLVDLGADVKAKANNGTTALHLAAWRGNEAMVRLLVDLGADVKAKDNRGKTVLHWAAWGGNEAVVQLLVDRGADVKAKDNRGSTVLHSGAEEGNEAVVRLLVERGADVNVKANNGKMALHLAAEEWYETVVRLLVEREADVKAKDMEGKTALYWAALGGKEAMVRLLVERGADVKAKDNDGKTVLHLAASGGNEAVVRLLVERGADVRAKDMEGKTVLHSAASSWRGNEAVVRLLRDLGADMNAKDNDGITALK
jgi:ankyrin repeat protein